MQGASPVAELLDSNVLAGFCSTPTPDILVLSGGFSIFPGTARSFEATSPVQAGASADLVFEGQPGDLVFLDIATAPGSIAWPFTTGIWQLDFASYYKTQFYGALPASGQLTVSVPIPPLAGPLPLYLQADVFDVNSLDLTLSGGSYLLLLP